MNCSTSQRAESTSSLDATDMKSSTNDAGLHAGRMVITEVSYLYVFRYIVVYCES